MRLTDNDSSIDGCVKEASQQIKGWMAVIVVDILPNASNLLAVDQCRLKKYYTVSRVCNFMCVHIFMPARPVSSGSYYCNFFLQLSSPSAYLSSTKDRVPHPTRISSFVANPVERIEPELPLRPALHGGISLAIPQAAVSFYADSKSAQSVAKSHRNPTEKAPPVTRALE